MPAARFRHPWLFAGADVGFYGLPDELVQAKATADRLLRHSIPPAPVEDGVERAARRLLEAAQSDGELLVWVDESASREDRESARVASRALEQARDSAVGEVNDIVDDYRDMLITDHVATAYAAVVEEARTLGPVVQGVGPGLTAVAKADAKTRAALVEFDALGERYAGLRGTWARLFELPESTQFPTLSPLWSEVRNADDRAVWPAYSPSLRAHHAAQAPWAGDSRARGCCSSPPRRRPSAGAQHRTSWTASSVRSTRTASRRSSGLASPRPQRIAGDQCRGCVRRACRLSAPPPPTC